MKKVNSCVDIIQWRELKQEIEQNSSPSLSEISEGYELNVESHEEKQDWIVQIIDSNCEEIGNLWFGPDPDNGWRFDGLVRVGTPNEVVWATFKR